MAPNANRVSFDDILGIDQDRCIVKFVDGTREQCSPRAQRYAKINIAFAHPAIEDVHFERIRGQRFRATLFISKFDCIEEVISGAKHSERHWLQNGVEVIYRTARW